MLYRDGFFHADLHPGNLVVLRDEDRLRVGFIDLGMVGRLDEELRRTLHPRAILPVKLAGRVVPPHIMQGVIVFFLFYMLTFAVCSAVVIVFGADIVTGISATAACLGNVGPGFGAVGPMGNFADLHPVSRIALTLAMWIGRLEVITVLVILRPEAWRSGRWSSAARS